MMTNLFSIFDPSTQFKFTNNWMSITLLYLLIPMYKWVTPSRNTTILSNLMSKLLMEFKPILNKMTYMSIFTLALFMLIMVNNITGLMPYIFSSTSHMLFSMPLAFPMWLTMMIYAILKNTNNLLIHQIPMNTPLILMPFMVIIEMISNLIRPLTLSIRLAANMIAGHLLIALLMSATPLAGLFYPILFIPQMMLTTLEMAVTVIQAYVFSVLMSLYLAEMSN